jgi:hypothetical protein
MNEYNQKIAIAEACWWTREYADVPTWNGRLNNYKGGYEPIRTLVFRRKEKCVIAENLPDYLNDLNAMREAEQTLPRDKQDFYDHYLSVIVMPCGANRDFLLIHATAAQKAEAFLKTLNLWEGK